MVTFCISASPLLDDIQQLYQTSKCSELEPERFEAIRDTCNRLSSLLKCNSQQLVLISWFLQRHFNNEELSVIDLVDHLGLKPSAAISINSILLDFVKKDWIKPCEDISCQPFSSYTLNKRFLQAIISGNLTKLKPKRIRTVFDLLGRAGMLFQSRKNNEITYTALKVEIVKLVRSHPNFQLCKFIRQNSLSQVEQLLFLTFCYQHYCGNDLLSVENIIYEVGPEIEDQFRIRQQFKYRKGLLFDNNLLEKAFFTDFVSNEYKLTDHSITQFSIVSTSTSEKVITPRFFEKIVPEKIIARKLFYSPEITNQVFRVEHLMKEDNFKMFVQHMQEKGMIPGLTILLYGSSGTGKTETVLQLAKNTGRTIMMADASCIRSKWVGETDKNVRKLFKEYRRVMRESPIAPILLFNEADGIIGKRMEVTDRVDVLENSLQNILLQELEAFEGIFMATTNLERNFDPAFDRRILYKINFPPPSRDMTMAIWREKLPETDINLLNAINEQYLLTGGQVENIRKKIEIDVLLDQDLHVDYEYLKSLAEAEVDMRAIKSRNPVGFIQAVRN